MERMILDAIEQSNVRQRFDNVYSQLAQTEAVAYYETVHLNPLKPINVERLQYDLYQKVLEMYGNKDLTVEGYIRSVLWRHLYENRKLLAVIEQRVKEQSSETQDNNS